MSDNEITVIVGWPTEPEMVKFRAIAAAAEKAERERCIEAVEGNLAGSSYGLPVRIAALIVERIRGAKHEVD